MRCPGSEGTGEGFTPGQDKATKPKVPEVGPGQPGLMRVAANVLLQVKMFDNRVCPNLHCPTTLVAHSPLAAGRAGYSCL